MLPAHVARGDIFQCLFTLRLFGDHHEAWELIVVVFVPESKANQQSLVLHNSLRVRIVDESRHQEAR